MTFKLFKQGFNIRELEPLDIRRLEITDVAREIDIYNLPMSVRELRLTILKLGTFKKKKVKVE